MVFHLVSESETPPAPPMASSTCSASKSQPLHNFSLSNLKWSLNHSNAQRLRRVPIPEANAAHLSPSHHHSQQHRPVSSRRHGDLGQSPELLGPSSAFVGKNEHRIIKLQYPNANSSGSVSDSGKSGFFSVSGAENLTEKEEKSDATSLVESLDKKLSGNGRGVEEKEGKFKGSEGKSKIFIRIPARKKAAIDAADGGDEQQSVVEEEEPAAKTWNLRPRRGVTKPPNVNAGAAKSGGVLVQDSKPRLQSRPEMALARAAAEENIVKKRQEFSVSLLKEEIEEDFLIMTGSRPPRRPKKRARNVQRQLDEIFPGLWLTSVTPDMYRVPDSPLKG